FPLEAGRTTFGHAPAWVSSRSALVIGSGVSRGRRLYRRPAATVIRAAGRRSFRVRALYVAPRMSAGLTWARSPRRARDSGHHNLGTIMLKKAREARDAAQ